MKVRVRGVELSYSVDGGGPGLVWISGTGIGGQAWQRAQVPAFAPYFTCLTFDLRGTGESAAPRDGYSVATMAEEAVALTRHVFGDRPVTMIGFSLGSAVVQEIAIRWPQQVSAAVLIATWSQTSREHHIRRWFDARSLALRSSPLEVFQAFSFLMWSHTFVDDEPGRMADLERFFADITGSQPLHAYEGHFRADLAHDTYERLQVITAPTLVLYGDEDLVTLPRYNKRVASAIPGAQDVCVPAGGHFVWAERPETVNTAIAAFLHEQGLGPELWDGKPAPVCVRGQGATP